MRTQQEFVPLATRSERAIRRITETFVIDVIREFLKSLRGKQRNGLLICALGSWRWERASCPMPGFDAIDLVTDAVMGLDMEILSILGVKKDFEGSDVSFDLDGDNVYVGFGMIDPEVRCVEHRGVAWPGHRYCNECESEHSADDEDGHIGLDLTAGSFDTLRRIARGQAKTWRKKLWRERDERRIAWLRSKGLPKATRYEDYDETQESVTEEENH